MQASDLRKSFLTNYIIKFDTHLYKSVVERDWAYICRREYNYNVLLTSWAYGFLGGNVALSARIFLAKKMVWWPLLVITPIVALYAQGELLQKHNKKLFDMCNVGEQYFLGRKRNEVLKECNELLDQEDF